MQKLAVALTTQEELEIYNNWRESKGWTVDITDECHLPICIEHNRNGEWGKLSWYEKYSGCKIISLKEAIGEQEDDIPKQDDFKYNSFEDRNYWYSAGKRNQLDPKAYPICRKLDKEERSILLGMVNKYRGQEDKEIIREGEARGFEPKTGDRVMASEDKKEWFKLIYLTTVDNQTHAYVCTNHIGSNNIDYWYFIKPIEEPKKDDWIDEAYNYYQTPMPARDKNNDVRYPMKFREAIEKHMPKQLVTEKDVEDYAYSKFSTGRMSYAEHLKDFLKSKGLIKE